ncbi:MAG: pectinesterase family protein, partial [Bacteroidetes bacterium]|nr:pectinesterase family protein [Bacteroidota bacterium]
VIYFNDNANTLSNGNALGTFGSSAFFVNGASFTANNITFQNNSGVAAGQAVAVAISGDKASFRNCRFLGFQDVLYCKNSGISSYFNNCYIEGTVDFIFGASTSWFENCYIFCKNRASGGVVAAPNTAAGTSFGSPWGFVFNGCKINGASTMTGLYYLARPWQNKPQAVYLNTSISDVINAAGWSSNSAGAATTADVSYGEFNNTGTGANGGSRSVGFATMLNSTQAANYTTSNVLGSWDPCSGAVSSMCSTADFPMATANFTATQTSISTSTLGWNMCWPIAMTYTVKRSVNNGAYSTINTTNGTSTNYNYSITDNSLQTGINKYIIEMTYNGNTYTSTDTLTVSNQPTITSTVTSLSALVQTIGTPSASQNFNISGSNLTNNITVTAPTNFQVSTNNSSWSSSVTYTQSAGIVASSLVYVRLNAGSNGSYSGNVVLSTTSGTSVNVAVTGTTSAVPAYTASLLQEWLLTSNNNDNSATRAVGVNSSTPTFNKLATSDNTTIITGSTTMPAYGATFGMGFGPIATSSTLSNGNWATSNNGTGGNLSRNHYVQFTVSGQTGYTLRLDSIILQSAFYNTSSNTKFAIVYSKSGFTTADSTDIASGGLFNGAAIGTGFGAFANPVVLANQTGGPTNRYNLPFTTNTNQSSGGGITLSSGQTLTVRIYFACGSSSAGRYGMLRNVQFKGSVTPPAPTVSSFSPTAQISGGSVVITGTNFSGVTAVSFGGTPATSFIVNSGTQITAVVATGTSGSVSVTTGSGTATLAGFTFQTPTTYYNVASTDVTDVNNWGINTDGSGTHPSNFTDALQTFRVYNTGATMSGAWTVSGNNSKISINSNCGAFNQTQVITGTVNLENDASLEIKVANAPTFGTISNGSTVGYSASGIDQTITAANYANLTLNGSGLRTFPSSLVGIAGQFTTNTYTSANSGSIISFNGTSPQTIPAFSYDSLIINNSNGSITQGGGSSVVVNKGCNISQNLTVDAGDTWVMAGSNGVAFTVASGKTLTVSGTLDNQSTGVAAWGTLSSSSSAATVLNADSARFVINNSGVYKINAAVTNSYFIGVGNYKSGSSIQVLQGSPRIPAYIGGNLLWNANAVGVTTIVQQASNTIGGNFTVSAGQINNGSGGTARALTVLGNLTVNGGEYDVNGNTAGTSNNQVLNVYGDITVSSGKLYPTISTNAGTGTINAYGNISLTGGSFANATGALVGNNVALLGSTAKTVSGFTASPLTLTIDNTAGVTFSGNTTVNSAVLTNGIVTMGANTLTANSVSKTNGWVVGKLSKLVATGASVAATFEIGNATNYLPVTMSFNNVTIAGYVAVSINAPITAVANYGTSVVSPTDYINRYWTMSNSGVVFSNYNATFNYLAGDINGAATSSSVFAYLYNASWLSQTVSGGSNSNTIINATVIGNVIFGNDCTPTTPTVSISTATSTVCSGSTVIFNAIGTNTGTSPVYQWKKNGNNVATGSSITFPANTLSNGDIITCVLTANNPCQTTGTATSNAITMTVNQSPASATIGSQYGSNTTAFTMCTLGSQISLYPSVANGIWSSSNPSLATVGNGGSSTSTSNVTAVSNGTANIVYTLQTTGTTCTTSTTIVVTVAQQATPNAVTGVSSICTGNSTTFATTSTGGVFSALGRFNINGSNGFATATSAGTTSVKYTITNAYGCSASSSLNVTVNALPATPSIAFVTNTPNPFLGGGGGLNICRNRTFSLRGTPAGGVWGATNPSLMSILPNGVASTSNINLGGPAGITYTITDPSTTCTSSRTIGGYTVITCAYKGVTPSVIGDKDAIVATLYPNPAHSTINLTVKTLVGSGSIVVTDLYGKTVKQQPLSIGTNTINVSSFAKGMYLVSVITEQGKQTQKVVVE